MLCATNLSPQRSFFIRSCHHRKKKRKKEKKREKKRYQKFHNDRPSDKTSSVKLPADHNALNRPSMINSSPSSSLQCFRYINGERDNASKLQIRQWGRDPICFETRAGWDKGVIRGKFHEFDYANPAFNEIIKCIGTEFRVCWKKTWKFSISGNGRLLARCRNEP